MKKLEFFLEKSLIPEDGSEKIIDNFYKNVDDETLEILIYPDVHYKKGSKVVNGMLTSSSKFVFPSMLGVANCGFTFGKIEGANKEQLEKLERTFREYSKVLKAYNDTRIYSDEEVYKIFLSFLEKFWNDERYKPVFEFLGLNSKKDFEVSLKDFLDTEILSTASKTLGTLGGGNHFFELHYVQESFDNYFKEGDVIFILHTDSISVGDKIYLLFSNLDDLKYLKNSLIGRLKFIKFRLKQINYFLFKTGLFLREPKEVSKLIFSANNYRGINAYSDTGKTLIKAFFFASVFGEMNRSIILQKYEKILRDLLGNTVNLNVLASHSHDSLIIEKNNGKYRIVQRNGVQYIYHDKYYILPGALGTDSYIMKNTYNSYAYFSANHGVGRILDKHIAKEKFDEEKTKEELAKRNLKLFRIGTGDISEQNPKAFKDVGKVVDIMQKYNLGIKAAKLKPICSMKG